MPRVPPVDFSTRRVGAIRVASIVRVGPWKVDNLRTEFGEIVRWAKRGRLRGGRWIFLERGRHRWEACLEIRGTPRVEGRVRLRTLRGGRVACVVFDPRKISSRLVYHGLRDWVRAHSATGRGRVTEIREVYRTDPWKSIGAWAHCEVQFVLGT
jgi:hypothetical protein